VTHRRSSSAAAQVHPRPDLARAKGCTHTDPMRLRLIEYTRYGTWIGCVECGTSWLIRSRD